MTMVGFGVTVSGKVFVHTENNGIQGQECNIYPLVETGRHFQW